MTSPDDVISLKLSEIHGQYFPLSNFKKKNTLVYSSLSSIRLGLSPKGSVKRKRPRRKRVAHNHGVTPIPDSDTGRVKFTNKKHLLNVMLIL